MSIVKRVRLTNPNLINLRNRLRCVLYNKYYDTLARLWEPRRELSDLCYNIKMELEIEGRYKFTFSDDIVGDLSKDMDYIINDLEKFIGDIRDSGLDAEDIYTECRRKIIEVTRYEQALRRAFLRSIIKCGFGGTPCGSVSTSDMYLIPDLGLDKHSWNRMWVCPKHFEYYRREIIFYYGVDVSDLTYPIKLKQKSPQELEKMYDDAQK